MGASASKAARKLPTRAPSVVPGTSGAADTAMRAAQAAAAEQAKSDARSAQGAEGAPASSMDYGGVGGRPAPTGTAGRQTKKTPDFSGEKDEQILEDGRDPHLAANLAQLGQVSVPNPGVTIPARAQRTLRARDPTFTERTATPPPGMISAESLAQLLDAFKSVPPGRDARALYDRLGVDAAAMAPIRRYINSPSVASEERRVNMVGPGGQTVQDVVELKSVPTSSTAEPSSVLTAHGIAKAVWIDARDKDAPKSA